jgi:hypothetical protein
MMPAKLMHESPKEINQQERNLKQIGSYKLLQARPQSSNLRKNSSLTGNPSQTIDRFQLQGKHTINKQNTLAKKTSPDGYPL